MRYPPATSIRSLCLLAILAMVQAHLSGQTPAKTDDILKTRITPLLKQFCVDCHNPEKQKGDLDLTAYLEGGKLYEHRRIWQKVVEMLEEREMPPEKKPQPSEADRDSLVDCIQDELSKFNCNLTLNPGRVTIRRLNREEYKNSVRDLVGVDYQLDDFPNDEVGYGFDNIGDVLSLSPMLMEKFVHSAEQISRRAIITDTKGKPIVKKLRGDLFTSPNDWVRPLDSKVLGLYREGEGTAEADFPLKGEYLFRIKAYGDQAGPEAPKLALRVAAREIGVFNVSAAGKSGIYEIKAPIEPGKQKIAVAFLNNYKDLVNADPKLRGDRNLFVESVEITSPAPPPPPLPKSHVALIPKMPPPGQELAYAREYLWRLASKAFRRPATEAEVERLTRFVELALKNGGTFLEGMQVGVQATLCSPRFLFRWELDPPGMKAGQVRDLTDYEVATRLSYFLWSSTPDEELLRLAETGMLRKDGNLEKQVQRLMKDPRSRRFVNNFSGQWLQTRNIWDVNIDPERFPGWNNELKGMMKEETELFFDAIMRENRPVTDLLTADFTFLNEKLARHYGIEGVQGENFRRVTVSPESHRGGVLTQGSVLLSTSMPTRTSPVIRGKWILEEILGSPPPPPPPNVPALGEEKKADQSAALRVRLEQHRSQPLCAGCHGKMDPLGFALENFDAVGRWRAMDGKFPIDASGKLKNGDSFNGPEELKKALSGDDFIRCLTEKMMTYALGRGLEYYDDCAVDDVIKKVGSDGNRFSTLVTAIATSSPFLKRTVDTPLASN